MKAILKRAFVFWFVICAFAILNGGLRDEIIAPRIGDLKALVLSGLLLIAFIFIAMLIFVRWLGVKTTCECALVGLFLAGLTVAFETGMVVASGKSLSQLLSAYDVTTGNLWSFVVLTLALSPLLAARLRRLVLSP